MNPPSGRLASNVMHFARLLRATGMRIGPGRVIEALHALDAVDVTHRDDFYWALHAVFVHRGEDRELFREAFGRFWRDPFGPEEAMAALLPRAEVAREAAGPDVSRRVADALGRRGEARRPPPPGEEHPRVEMSLTYSPRETLRTRDFREMSAEEIEEAKRAVESMRLSLPHLRTRRFRPTASGARVDPRRTLRASLRAGGSHIPLQWRRRRTRTPTLVVLCDVSGSMERYSRMLLHFLHVLTNRNDQVHVFLFGTRLTNVTRHLRHRDVDEALRRVGETVEDWSGGTRIGACLEAFNLRWSRRVLGQEAAVLLISDGLDRDEAVGLERQVERLRRSCRHLIWLNPLLRYEAFEPRARGIRAILPHVDDFRPVHNLESLEGLARALGGRSGVTRRGPGTGPAATSGTPARGR